jgi:hypothetical protein
VKEEKKEDDDDDDDDEDDDDVSTVMFRTECGEQNFYKCNKEEDQANLLSLHWKRMNLTAHNISADN